VKHGLQNNLTADRMKFRWIFNSWIDLSKKTMNISSPRIIMISHLDKFIMFQLVLKRATYSVEHFQLV
jgi:hypothetical protein